MQVQEHISETRIKGRWRRRGPQIAVGIVLLLMVGLYLAFLVEFTTDTMVLQPGIYTAPCRFFTRTRNVAFAIGLVYLGLNLLASRKRPVLFLRRFGLDVNSVVSRVIRKGLGRQFRFVTLDDGRFPAIDIPALERWTTRLGPPVLAVVLVIGAVAAQARFASQPSSNGAYEQTAAQMSFLMAYWVAIFWVLLMLAWMHSLQMRRKSRLQVRNGSQLAKLLFEVGRLGQWRLRLSLLCPQAIVAKVTNSLWQECVSSVSARCGMVLIDLSEPTENLSWEVEHSRQAGLNCVFIAEKKRLESWARAMLAPVPGSNVEDDGGGANATAAERIGRFVEDDCVLVYDGEQKLGGAAFQRSLRALLHRASAEATRTGRGTRMPLADRLWRVSVATIYHGLVLLAAVVSGIVLGVVVQALTTEG